MIGYLSGSELSDVYRDVTIFVLLMSWFEGFLMVLVEAMDVGFSIVTTSIRGVVDYLVVGEHVFFVESEDIDGLASAMIVLLHDPDLRARMGLVNRECVQIFEPGVVVAEYLEILQTFIREQ